MNGAALAPALLFAALGLVLSFASSRRVIAWSLGAAVVAAGMAVAGPIDGAKIDALLVGCWISIVVTIMGVYLPRPPGLAITLPLSVNAGVWAGLTVAASGAPFDIVPALGWALLCVPGAWLVGRGRGIALKVAGSWLAAAAVLSLGLGMVPTLGYEPDHRE